MWTHDPEKEVMDVCRELGIGFVPYSQLGRGSLTGKIKKPEDLPEDDFRLRTPRFQGDNFQRNPISWRELARLLARRNACRHSSRSPGCWHKAKILFRFREQNATNFCRKTSVHSMSILAMTIWLASRSRAGRCFCRAALSESEVRSAQSVNLRRGTIALAVIICTISPR